MSIGPAVKRDCPPKIDITEMTYTVKSHAGGIRRRPPVNPALVPINRSGGRVEASLADVPRAGYIDFDTDDDKRIVMTLRIEVQWQYQCQGVASQLISALLDAFPTYELVESSNPNDEDGNQLLSKLRSRGVPYHLPTCFRNDRECHCNLHGRMRAA